LLYDIETSPLIAATFGLWEQNIPHTNIIQDTFIICAAWQWHGKKRVESVSVLDDPKRFKKDHTDDYHVVKTLHGLIQQADVIVGHYANSFDWKRFMARVVYHKLPPLNIPVMIDTVKEVKRFSFTSNKLDYLGAHLGVERKLAKDTGLWLGAARGEADKIKKMVVYNRGDLPPLAGLYDRLRPYMTNHPNHNLFTNGHCCRNCGSESFQKRGYRRTAVSVFQRYQCNDCHAWFESKHSIKRASFK
jgi:hypothetical protein